LPRTKTKIENQTVKDDQDKWPKLKTKIEVKEALNIKVLKLLPRPTTKIENQTVKEDQNRWPRKSEK
jgi:hypothetical protein